MSYAYNIQKLMFSYQLEDNKNYWPVIIANLPISGVECGVQRFAGVPIDFKLPTRPLPALRLFCSEVFGCSAEAIKRYLIELNN